MIFGNGFWLYFPIALMLGLGCVIKATGYLSESAPKYMLEYVLRVALPMVVFHGVTQVELQDFSAVHKFVAAHTLLIVLFQFGSLIGYRLVGLSVNAANSLSSVVFFSNIPFFALPFLVSMPNAYQYIHLLTLGFLVSLMFFVFVTIRIYIFSYENKFRFALHSIMRELSTFPLVFAACMGFVLVVLQIKPLPYLTLQVEKFHSVIATTALIALGMGLKLDSILKCDLQMWVAVIAKSVLMPLTACFLADFFQLDSSSRLVLVAMAACPTATVAVLVGYRFSQIEDKMNDVMTASTILSLFLYGFWIQQALLPHGVSFSL